jgi:hypothetical protein
MTNLRYVSDGDELYLVKDMPALLAQPKDTVLKFVYIYTKYNYDFEFIIMRMLKAGILEQADKSERYTYPFKAVAATLDDLRTVFTVDEVAAMDGEVAGIWAGKEPTQPTI